MTFAVLQRYEALLRIKVINVNQSAACQTKHGLFSELRPSVVQHTEALLRSAACRIRHGQLSELPSTLAVLQRYEALLRIKIAIVISLITAVESLGV